MLAQLVEQEFSKLQVAGAGPAHRSKGIIMKVAYSSRHGGFSISEKAINYMIHCGHPIAQKIKNEQKRSKSDVPSYWIDESSARIRRHDQLLIQAIESLGEEANGQGTKIQIDKINDYDHYQIDDNDGLESIRIFHVECDCHG